MQHIELYLIFINNNNNEKIIFVTKICKKVNQTSSITLQKLIKALTKIVNIKKMYKNIF